METISEALATAESHYRAGRLLAAEQIYRQILAVEPNHAQAWNLLGVVQARRGNRQDAAECIRRAIGLNANAAAFHSNLGSVYQALNQPDQAVACYRRALELKPERAEVHYNLANAVRQQGKPDEAVAGYRRAIELKSDYAEAHSNLGTLLHELGRAEEAAACYRRALELKSDFAEANYNLGNVLLDLRNPDEAVACYRRALELKPDHAEAHFNLGNAFRAQRKADEAVACFRRALELKPDYAEAENNLGTVLHELGRRDEAVACYRRARQLKPELPEAHNNLGNALREQGQRREAADCYRQALELKPDYPEAHNNLGTVLQELGKPDEAVACYRRAAELDPDNLAVLGALAHQLQHLCQWPGLAGLSRRVIEAVEGDAGVAGSPMSPFAFLTLPAVTTSRQQWQCARRWAERGLALPAELACGLASARPPHRKSKITIGYLSADFHSHPTAQLIAELFEKHDRGRFSIVGYSYGPDDGSPMRKRLVDAVDRFVDVKDSSFVEAARRIAADEVDIVVDLKGYTTDARTQIVALRPAPIQVNYLGYPSTMGASFVDYIVVDDFIVPAEQQPFFTEKLVHLPGCYQANDSRREIAPRTPSRAECGLPDEGFVFYSFNNNYKITPEVFGAWMRLLAGVPGSVLWLLEGHRTAAGNLRREAQARGVPPERLVFAPRIEPSAHLARQRLADLFLDTFPVSAHTTASDALWAGCPLVTIAGETFVSRVAGSLLRGLGLGELIATSLQDYEALALRLARDQRQLAELRARLSANRASSALFDGGQFAEAIEQAYATMWEIHAAGQPPRAFRVGPA